METNARRNSIPLPASPPFTSSLGPDFLKIVILFEGCIFEKRHSDIQWDLPGWSSHPFLDEDIAHAVC